jgi:hypothetical protein
MFVGPHRIADTPIYAKRDNQIFATQDGFWAIKRTKTSDLSKLDEIRYVLTLAAAPPRNCVEFPHRSDLLFGTAHEEVWYAMSLYDGPVKPSDIICRSNWKQIACSVLEFLEDLHCRYGLAHMDIKPSNILMDRRAHRFVVSDFELLVCPGSSKTPQGCADRHTQWYYLGFGAEWSEPMESWRMDLVMVGYLLADLTWNPDFSWPARDFCWDVAEGKILPDSPLELLRERDQQLRAGAAPVVVTYLDRVAAAVPWGLKPPPPHAFYEELRALFR